MRFVNQHDPLIFNILIYIRPYFLGGVALGGVGPLDSYDHPTLAVHPLAVRGTLFQLSKGLSIVPVPIPVPIFLLFWGEGHSCFFPSPIFIILGTQDVLLNYTILGWDDETI